MAYLIFVCRAIVGLLLVWAGTAKLADIHGFAIVLRGYRLLPKRLEGLASHVLPAGETLIGVGLVSGILLNWFALAAVCLVLVFAAAVAINLLRGNHDITCGCFGLKKGELIGWDTVGRSLTLAGAAAVPALRRTSAEIPVLEQLVCFFIAAAAIGMSVVINSIRRMWMKGPS